MPPTKPRPRAASQLAANTYIDPDSGRRLARSGADVPFVLIPPDPNRGVAVLGEISASGVVDPYIYDDAENPERIPLLHPGLDRVYALRIKGDSMIPSYYPGDLVIVQDMLVSELVDGEVVVIQFDGSQDGKVAFKRARMIGQGRLSLEPINPKFKTCECKIGEVVRIGRVLSTYTPESARAARKLP